MTMQTFPNGYPDEPESCKRTADVDSLMRIGQVLIEHRAVPPNSPYCKCGWRPALSLNDTESDRGQHIEHQAEMILESAR